MFTTTRVLGFHRITILTRVVILFLCFLKRYHFCCLWWVGSLFSLLHPLFAVFYSASAFNQDVSKWNTGAVTTMGYSKCTLSLCGHGAFRCGVLLNIYDNSPCCCCLCGGFGLSFLCCTLLSSCSVLLCICVQSGRVHLEYGGGDKNV